MTDKKNQKNNKDRETEDEFVFEEDEGTTYAQKDKLKKIREKLAKCEEEKREYLSGWQRAKADMVNLRKKQEEEKKNFTSAAEKNLIEDLLPTLESFEMAFKNKEVWESISENWRSGIEYIYSQMWETLSQRGLKKIQPQQGDEFDTKIHESVENVETSEEAEDGKIKELVRTGYMLGDKVLRPAKVNVSHFK